MKNANVVRPNVLTMKFKVQSVTSLVDPRDTDRRKWLLFVDTKNLPADIPMMTNPREQKLSTKVANKISKSLLNPNTNFFHILNRGITISASNIHHNKTKGTISLDFIDLNVHGNIDGGHTYKIINRDKSLMEKDEFVFIEVLEGYEDIFTDVAEARNTSTQVKDYSIAELKNKYELIKEAIKGTSIEEHVAYKENIKKPILIEDLIALCYMFDIKKFSNEGIDVPVASANSRTKCRNHYLKMLNSEANPFEMMFDIIPDIIALASYIEITMPKAYDKSNREMNGVTKSFFGRNRGITTLDKNDKDYFAMFAPTTKVKHIIPKGILFPIIGSLRYILELNETTNKFEWKTNPFTFIGEILPTLTMLSMNKIRSANRSAAELGRDKDHWRNLYNQVEMKYLRDTIRNK